MPQVSTAQKMATVLRYLELGGEWEHKEGIRITIVWLDNHVTHTSTDGIQYGIHGLAKKYEKVTGDITVPHYVGIGYDFNTIVQMVDEISDEDYLGMVAAVALKQAVIKRRGKL